MLSSLGSTVATWSSVEPTGREQEVVVGVDSRGHLRGGRGERGAAVDVLDPGRLRGRGVLRRPHGARCTRPPAVHVTAEDGRAGRVVPRQDTTQLAALGVVGTSR